MKVFKCILVRLVPGLLLLAALVWMLDFLSVRLNIPKRELYSVIRVDQLKRAF